VEGGFDPYRRGLRSRSERKPRRAARPRPASRPPPVNSSQLDGSGTAADGPKVTSVGKDARPVAKAVTKVPVVPSYSSTAPSKASATNRSPLGPRARPAGWMSPPPRNGTKVLTKAPVVPSYSRTAASAEGKVLPLLP